MKILCKKRNDNTHLMYLCNLSTNQCFLIGSSLEQVEEKLKTKDEKNLKLSCITDDTDFTLMYCIENKENHKNVPICADRLFDLYSGNDGTEIQDLINQHDIEIRM